MKKVILVVLATLGVAVAIAARREVRRAEAEAALWAEATDPIE
ncbi:DLW-39 family protein [Tessaracoccus sp. SD287]|nr:DLW-39 family protein [Tessaracoccus sp. SD287]